METKRKYLVEQTPEDCGSFPCHVIEQTYLYAGPMVRVHWEDDNYYLTHKGRGLLSRGEYNLPLNEQTYRHLLVRADGIILTKKRYLVSVEGTGHLTTEMDVSEGSYRDLILTEVKFPIKEEAMASKTFEWFGRDVTFSGGSQSNRPACGNANTPCKQV